MNIIRYSIQVLILLTFEFEFLSGLKFHIIPEEVLVRIVYLLIHFIYIISTLLASNYLSNTYHAFMSLINS